MAWNIQDIKDRLLYRQAVETARAACTTKFGEGFEVTDAVVATIRKFQPVY